MSLNLEAILELLKQHVSPAAQRVPKGWEIIAREAHRQGVIDGRAIQMESAVHCDAAGASEGKAQPVAWMTVSDGCIFYGSERPDRVCEECVPLYLNPSAELTALRERIAGMEKAITPFVDAFEEIHARSYEGADAQFAAFLDRNTVTPSMTVGDFRRLRDAAIAKEKQQ